MCFNVTIDKYLSLWKKKIIWINILEYCKEKPAKNDEPQICLMMKKGGIYEYKLGVAFDMQTFEGILFK